VRFRHVILDRDGVLNREARDGSYVLTPAQFDWLPGALEGLALLHHAGVRVSVVTNQSAVGRGLMSLEQLEAVHLKMSTEAARGGGVLDAVLFCPHAPQDLCECRKPAPALLLEAVSRAGIGAGETLAAGDDLRDLEAAERAGIEPALLLTGKGQATRRRLADADRTARTYDDLLQLARALASGTA
jgi:D-glycero-D-manno-heptose 1,7-bisphosphate phosphatase